MKHHVGKTLDLIVGQVIGLSDGGGIVRPSSDNPRKIHLSRSEMRHVFCGDKVSIRLVGRDRLGRLTGEIKNVLERARAQMIGRYFRDVSGDFVRSEDPLEQQAIRVPTEHNGEITVGQLVLVDILKYPSKREPAFGRIIKVIGDPMNTDNQVQIAIQNHSIPNFWTDAVCQEIKLIEEDFRNFGDRVDLRDTPLFTIDGDKARDFDDAVFSAPKPHGGWRLIVAIADVSYFVESGSSIDMAAAERGNSVYFPNTVVPMLPEALSNNLCSLLPGKDRFCFACEIHLDDSGDVFRYEFYEAIMNSRARMTYSEVSEILENCADPINENLASLELVAQIDSLNTLCDLLLLKRKGRGAINFESQETEMFLDSHGKIEQLRPVIRSRAHEIIEESMLCANFCAAEFLNNRRIPTLYRVHLGPNEDRLSSLREFLGGVGLTLAGGDAPQPVDYQNVLSASKVKEDTSLIQSVLLRSMSRACYQPNNEGHFGLNYSVYVHFTSPIRRYSDLLVHRALKNAIRASRDVSRGSEVATRSREHGVEPLSLIDLGNTLSFTERRADEAARDVASWLKCEFLLDKIGNEVEGIIVGVQSFGLFIQIDELYVEGLLHVKALPRDYYHYEDKLQQLAGERSGRIFTLGQRIKAVVAHVDLQGRKIDLAPLRKKTSKKKRKKQHVTTHYFTRK